MRVRSTRTIRVVVLLSSALLGLPSARAAAPPVPSVLCASVAKGCLWVPYVKGKSRFLFLASTPLVEGKGRRDINLHQWSVRETPRWHMAHGAFWGCLDIDAYNKTTLHEDVLFQANLSGLLKGRFLAGPDDRLLATKEPVEWSPTHFAYDPLDWLRTYASRVDFRPEFYRDCLAVGPNEVRTFLLMNIPDRLASPSLPPRLRGTVFLLNKEEQRIPVWSLNVYRLKARWDRTDAVWRDNDEWKTDEQIEVAFREPFRVFGRGTDYYFLTDSGSVYRAPEPARKGMPRQVLPIYQSASRPIIAAISDADSERTYLFVESAKGPAFFELSDKPELVAYDPKVADVPEGDEPLRSVMHKARVLAALGKIKGK